MESRAGIPYFANCLLMSVRANASASAFRCSMGRRASHRGDAVRLIQFLRTRLFSLCYQPPSAIITWGPISSLVSHAGLARGNASGKTDCPDHARKRRQGAKYISMETDTV